jgi:hypothetical protein
MFSGTDGVFPEGRMLKKPHVTYFEYFLEQLKNLKKHGMYWMISEPRYI